MNLSDNTDLLKEIKEGMQDPDRRVSLDDLQIIAFQFSDMIKPDHPDDSIFKNHMFKEIRLYHRKSGYEITIKGKE